MRSTIWTGAVAAAAILGAWAGRMTAGTDAIVIEGVPSRSDPTPVAPSPSHGADLAAASRIAREKFRDPETAPTAEIDSAALPLFSPALIAHFRSEYRAAYEKEYPEGPTEEAVAAAEKRFRDDVLAWPASYGEAEAALRRRNEASVKSLSEGDGFGALDALQNDAWDPSANDLTSELLEKLTARRIASPAWSPEEVAAFRKKNPREPLPEGLSIAFGPGVHVVDPAEWAGPQRAAVGDLSVSGAGMNTTLIVWKNDLDFRGDVRALTIKDLTSTVANDGCGPFDFRTPRTSLRLERVRAVGFDCGAGGSNLIGSRALVLYARGCEFLGGFGRTPYPNGYCSVLDVRGESVARFEQCRFDRAEPGSLQGKTLFHGCVFADLKVDLLANPGRGGFHFVDCRSESSPAGTTFTRRDLAEYFPNYRR
jgi:hypothetical protein